MTVITERRPFAAMFDDLNLAFATAFCESVVSKVGDVAMRQLLAVWMAVLAVSQASAGSVSGQAVDENGAPLSGVKVEVVYQTYNADKLMSYGASIKAQTQTDADGRYRVDVSRLPPGEYSAHAYTVLDNGGRQTNIDLVPDNVATFPSSDSTIRNFSGGYYEFTERDPYGNGGIFVVSNTIDDETDLTKAEVTLSHLATGRSIIKTVRSTGEGLIVSGIPFGAYRASVRVDGRPMRLSLMGPGYDDDFRDTVEHDFTMGWLGNQFRVQVKP